MSSSRNRRSIQMDGLATKDQKNPALAENLNGIATIGLSISFLVSSLNPVLASSHSQCVGRAH